MRYKNYTLDKFQEDAINAIEENKSVVVSAPTGSGKTLIAEYIIDKELKRNKNVVYTAPIKALSNQKFKDFCKEYGEDKIGLLTGDVVINPEAPIRIMTTEIYRNMVLVNDPSIQNISYVVFDEIHYIDDPERGYVWEESLIFSPENIRFLCLSATISNADELTEWIASIKKHEIICIIHNKRPVPLHHAFFDVDLGVTTLEEIRNLKRIPDYDNVFMRRKRKKDIVEIPYHADLVKALIDKTPMLFFCFSRRTCEAYCKDLSQKNYFKGKPEIDAIIREKLKKIPEDAKRLRSARILFRSLPKGIGFHHAGLLPVLKDLVEDLFSKGLINVLYTTETFAVGINMPAKTVCFDSLRKFDGTGFRMLSSKEYFQIAGRAGRRGIDKEGFVVSMIYRPRFDYKKLKRLTTAEAEPIQSRFRLSYNTVLNLMQRHSEKERNIILSQNFHVFQQKIKDLSIIRQKFDKLVKKLRKHKYLDGDRLTEKGVFASHIFVDELIFGEIFATDFFSDLSVYQTLLLLACLVYERRKGYEVKNYYRDKESKFLKLKIRKNPFLKSKKQFENIDELTGIIKPAFEKQNFFEILKNTNFLEGDMLRFFDQILDRTGQVKTATQFTEVMDRMRDCDTVVKHVIEEVFMI
ncbi:DEAD/DEAH box helicase [Candidatus Woesearchaeota archaeon]|nr:DEAD/DEAH box helicase [Candidatus Woesearchaeota archaeon]